MPPFAEEKPLQENERERETRTREDLYYVVVLPGVVDDDATPARVLFPPRVVEFFCGASTRTLHYVSHFPQGNAHPEREKDDPKRNLWIWWWVARAREEERGDDEENGKKDENERRLFGGEEKRREQRKKRREKERGRTTVDFKIPREDNDQEARYEEKGKELYFYDDEGKKRNDNE